MFKTRVSYTRPIHSSRLSSVSFRRRREEEDNSGCSPHRHTFQSQCQNTKQCTFSRRSAKVMSKCQQSWQLVALPVSSNKKMAFLCKNHTLTLRHATITQTIFKNSCFPQVQIRKKFDCFNLELLISFFIKKKKPFDFNLRCFS